jgi:NAD(P)H dehydrogenase (quinone)
MSMILVTGSAGKTGRAIIRALTKKRESVRAIAHSPEQVPPLRALGVEDVLIGDLLDPASVAQAVQGVRAVYHIAPNVNPDELDIGKTILRAARSANVERFIFHSVLRPQIEAMPHHWQKLRVEESILESGLPFTILQPTIYMQNLLAYWDQIVEDGIYPIPYAPETRLSMVDLEDVAEVAAMVVSEPGYQDAVFELVGVSATSPLEIASTLSQKLRRSVTVKVVSHEDWERNAKASGLGEYQVLTLIKMFCYYERYGLAGNSTTLSSLLQRQPAILADFVQRTVNEREDGFRAD